MGIYTREHPCGCVTSQGSWEVGYNPYWFEKRCEKNEKCSLSSSALKEADERKRKEEDADLMKRLGLTQERLLEIRNKKA